MLAKLHEYQGDGETFEGYLVYPAGAERAPCVLIAHDWSGVRSATHAFAESIARLGYVAFAVDLYGKGRRGDTPQASEALMMPFIEDRSRIHRRFALAIEQMQRDPRVDASRLAAIGHCFGGLCVLDMARIGADLAAVVSVHGVLQPPPQPTRPNMRTKVLLLHGERDPLAPPEDVAAISAELTRADADWQLHAFGGVMHAFTVPEANNPAAGLRYDARATTRSWSLITQFLREALLHDTRAAA